MTAFVANTHKHQAMFLTMQGRDETKVAAAADVIQDNPALLKQTTQ